MGSGQVAGNSPVTALRAAVGQSMSVSAETGREGRQDKGEAGCSLGLQAWGASSVRGRQTPAGARMGPQAGFRQCLRSSVQEAGGWDQRTDATVNGTQVTTRVIRGGERMKGKWGKALRLELQEISLRQATEGRSKEQGRHRQAEERGHGSRRQGSWGGTGPQRERPRRELAQ